MNDLLVAALQAGKITVFGVAIFILGVVAMNILMDLLGKPVAFFAYVTIILWGGLTGLFYCLEKVK